MQFFDDNGAPLAGGFLYSYEAGTAFGTPKATYTNAGAGTPNSNPVELDAAGRAAIWISGSYGFILKTSADVTIWSADNVTSFASGALGATVTDGSGFTVQNASDLTKQFQFSLANLTTGTTTIGTVPDGNFTFASIGNITAAFKDKILSGLALTTNGTDATNDIDIAAGVCVSDDGTTLMTLTAITKQLDVAWAVGANQGGLDTGAVGNNTYFIWAIHRTDTLVTDVLFSLSATSPTMPANYTKKKRIGAVHRVSAANEAPFPVDKFASSAQTITAAGALTIPHYLGVKPSAVFVELICASAEHNYSVGDVIQLPPVDSSGAASGQGVSIEKNDATNLNIRYGSAAATFIVVNKTDGTVESATNASWKMRLRAIP